MMKKVEIWKFTDSQIKTPFYLPTILLRPSIIDVCFGLKCGFNCAVRYVITSVKASQRKIFVNLIKVTAKVDVGEK